MSKLYPQLRGEEHVDNRNNSKCRGAQYVSEMFDNDTSRYLTQWGEPLKGSDYANPCGLIAKAFFNGKYYYFKFINNKIDTYRLYDKNVKPIDINQSHIANDYDRDYMYKRHPNYTKLQWMDVEDGIQFIFI
jgi:hypothetical protein